MCYFYITYEDGNFVECEHVTSVVYNGIDRTTKVAEDDLPQHCFPLGRALWLHTEVGTICVSGDGLRTIEVRQED